MSDAELEHLVAMANDIARNLAFNEDAEQRMVDHLERFWAPELRQRLQAHVASGGAGLSDLAMAAAKRLGS
jgi:formate dehydrogenase subunit delta